MSSIVLTRGGSRERNILRALSLLDHEINLRDKSCILVKPNIVSYLHPGASTSAVALQAVLEFIRKRYGGRIIVGEGTGFPAMEGYRRLGYIEIAKKYDAELRDLSAGPWIEVNVYDRYLNSLKRYYSSIVAESDYRVSLTLPKTHDALRVSLSIKNLAMAGLKGEVPVASGSLWRNMQRQVYERIPPWIKYARPVDGLKKYVVSRASANDRVAMHDSFATHNLNIYLLQKAFPVHLAVIDGFTGMEGDGPITGKIVSWGVAAASQDAIAADSLVAYLMGFNPVEIGYLYYCSRGGLGNADLKTMNIQGELPQSCMCKFQPSPIDKEQQRWKDGRIEKILSL